MSVAPSISTNHEPSWLDEVVAWRRDLHAHPELAFEEQRTADFVAAQLGSFGWDVHTGIAKTGVVGVLSKGDGPHVGLRADMDALPMTERNGFAHASTRAGHMHACGHDGHTSMLLAAARALAEDGGFQGTLYCVFQPAEEAAGGARAMIEDGLFDRFPIQTIYGLHNYPGMALGTAAIRAGAVMAAFDQFDIVIRASGGHAAARVAGDDAILAAGSLIPALQVIPGHDTQASRPAVLGLTQIEGGDSYNIRPDEVRLRGSVRTFSKTTSSIIETRMQELCDHLGSAHRVRMELRYRCAFPAVVNTPAESEIAADAARSVMGAEHVITQFEPWMASEDFSEFLQEKPGCFAFLGAGEAEEGANLHGPYYDFNDDLIPYGLAYWTEIARRATQGAAQ